jgi:hypothetical protein
MVNDLAVDCFVTIEIYDLPGKSIATLINNY